MNWQLLKGTVYSRGKTMQDLAKETGIVYSTLIRQCNSGQLTLQNMKKIKACLDLSGEEVKNIFFEGEFA